MIPADRWHEPYLSEAALLAEIGAGVSFLGCEAGGVLVGVMGVQAVRNVDLIRHAYVLPDLQGTGVGSGLIGRLLGREGRQLLVGTWAAAVWAVRFYERHGFALVPEAVKALLLETYWTVPERQVATSVVLALPHLGAGDAAVLVAGA